MKKFIQEFKEFAMRGNVVDMAVGVIIGGAFGAIVTSFINDLIMPLIGLLTGGVNFQDQVLILKAPGGETGFSSLEAAKELGASTLNYGAFITAVINFLIMSLVIFLMIKAINKLTALGKKKKKEEEEEVPTVKECPFCKSEIAIGATRCPHCTSELPEEKAE